MNLPNILFSGQKSKKSVGKKLFLEHTEWEYLLLKFSDLFGSYRGKDVRMKNLLSCDLCTPNSK